MSKLTLFNSLKADLTAVTGVKHVALWNNQIERENVENAFLYPAIFIDFLPSVFMDKGNLASSQQYDMTIRLHICFESYLDEDTSILSLVNNVWNSIHTKQYGTFGKLLRRNEEQNFDHPNIQEYIQDYATIGNETLNKNTVTATLQPTINIIP